MDVSLFVAPAVHSVPPAVSAYIERRGFEILRIRHFDAGAAAECEWLLRSMPWLGHRAAQQGGSIDTCASDGFGAVVVFNPQPKLPTPQQRRYWSVADALIIEALFPRHVYRGTPEADHANWLLMPASPAANRKLIDLLFPGEVASIQAEATQIARACDRPEPVLEVLTRHGLRARVDVVSYQGRRVVRKIFRPSQRRFLDRELLVRTRYAQHVPVPALIDHGDNWMIMEYRNDECGPGTIRDGLMPLPVVRRAFEALCNLHDAGLCQLDFTPHNVLVDRAGRVTLIDFEFLQPYPGRPPPFERHYALAGVPDAWTGDVPAGAMHSYAKTWQPRVGLPLASLLDDRPPVQHLKRIGRRLAGRAASVPRRVAGR